MLIELKVNGCLVYASVDEQPPDSEVYRRALAEAKHAIEKHRLNVHGADYDYEGDPTYKPEAELYRVLAIIDRALSIEKACEASKIPKDKNHPPDAVQCDDCGGFGDKLGDSVCATCEGHGWLPAGHPKGRKCERQGCGKPIPPGQVAIYCSNECAYEDA